MLWELLSPLGEDLERDGVQVVMVTEDKVSILSSVQSFPSSEYASLLWNLVTFIAI